MVRTFKYTKTSVEELVGKGVDVKIYGEDNSPECKLPN